MLHKVGVDSLHRGILRRDLKPLLFFLRVALRLGIVHSVLLADQLSDRAWEIHIEIAHDEADGVTAFGIIV